MTKLSGDRRYYSRLSRAAVRHYSPGVAESYRRSDEDYRSLPGDVSKFGFVRTAAASVAPAARILDLGCGTGRYLHCFDESAYVIGVDVSRPMLEEAREPVAGTADDHDGRTDGGGEGVGCPGRPECDHAT